MNATRSTRVRVLLFIAALGLLIGCAWWISSPRRTTVRTEEPAPPPVSTKTTKEPLDIAAGAPHGTPAGTPIAPDPEPKALQLDRVTTTPVLESGLPDIRAPKRLVTGVVVRANGDPAVSAHIQFGGVHFGVDALGGFALHIPERVDADLDLIATEDGSSAARMRRTDIVDHLAHSPLEPLRLELGPAPLSIRGRVMVSDGRALPGWTVFIIESPTGDDRRGPVLTEEALWSAERTSAVTDAEGRFEFRGLLAGELHIRAYERQSLCAIEPRAMRAGEQDVQLVLPTDSFVPAITGRLVARDGTGLVRMRVTLELTVSEFGDTIGRIPVTTAGDGGFRFENVPRHGVRFVTEAPELVPMSVPLENFDLSRALEVPADRLCRCRIELTEPPAELQFLIAVNSKQVRVPFSMDKWRDWTDAEKSANEQALIFTTGDLFIAESAVELVLYSKEGKALDKRPVTLVPGSTVTVKW